MLAWTMIRPVSAAAVIRPNSSPADLAILRPARANSPNTKTRAIIPIRPNSSPITAGIMSVWASGR